VRQYRYVPVEAVLGVVLRPMRVQRDCAGARTAKEAGIVVYAAAVCRFVIGAMFVTSAAIKR